MKIGRNEPCPCGSGKKYKHCCMSAVGKQHAEVFDEVQSMVAMNPNLSIEELNAELQHRMEFRNNRPHPDFCGLSPAQMANWLYAPFERLQFFTMQTPADLTTSPVMRYLQVILNEAMRQDGAFKATTKGNLPTTIVKQATELLPELAVAKFSTHISISEFAGSNEDKFNALHYTRVLAEICGIIYKRSGCFHVKKAAQQQYKREGLRAFFQPMLMAAIREYNWGYLDSFGQEVELRSFWLFMLWRIQHHQNMALLVDEMKTAFPDLLRACQGVSYASAEHYLSLIIKSRFIERFLQFWGFLIVEPQKYSTQLPPVSQLHIQPLFSQTFQFAPSSEVK